MKNPRNSTTLYPMVEFLSSETNLRVFTRDAWTPQLKDCARHYLLDLPRERFQRLCDYGNLPTSSEYIDQKVDQVLNHATLWELCWPDHELAVIDIPDLDALVGARRANLSPYQDIALWLHTHAESHQLAELFSANRRQIPYTLGTLDGGDDLVGNILIQLSEMPYSLVELCETWRKIAGGQRASVQGGALVLDR